MKTTTQRSHITVDTQVCFFKLTDETSKLTKSTKGYPLVLSRINVEINPNVIVINLLKTSGVTNKGSTSDVTEKRVNL